MRLAASYAGRLGLTAWRRKSTLLGLAAGLVLVVLCLQYNSASRSDPAVKPEENPQEPTSGSDDKPPLQRTLRNHQEGRNSDAAAKLSNDLRVPRFSDPEGGSNVLEDGGDALKRSIGGENVKFVRSEGKEAVVTASREGEAARSHFVPKVRVPPEQPAREDVSARKAASEQYSGEEQRVGVEVSTPGMQSVVQYNSYDQQGLYQMGIPYVNLDPRRPYVPEHRLVHFDLKGAPPKVGRL
jgi:hypothetical protein